MHKLQLTTKALENSELHHKPFDICHAFGLGLSSLDLFAHYGEHDPPIGAQFSMRKSLPPVMKPFWILLVLRSLGSGFPLSPHPR